MMKKNLIVIAILITLLSIASYLINISLSKKIESGVKELVREHLNKEIELSQARVSIFRGIIFKKMTIREKKSTEIWAVAQNVRFMPLLTSLFSQRKLLCSLTADILYFQLKKRKGQTLDITQLATPSEKVPSLLVKKIRIHDLHVDFEDEEKNIKKEFTNITFFADLSSLSKIHFTIGWQDKIILKGTYDNYEKNLESDMALKNIDLAELKPFMRNFKDLKNIDLKRGVVQSGKLKIRGNKFYTIEGDMDIKDLWFSKEEKGFIGDLRVSPTIHFLKGDILYALEGETKGAEIKNVPYLDMLSEIEARFDFDHKHLAVSSLKAKIKGNPIRAKGTIDYTLEPAFSLQINAQLPLEKFVKIAKTIKVPSSFLAQKEEQEKTLQRKSRSALPQTFKYQGKGDINLELILQGRLDREKIDYYGEYAIKGVEYKELKDIALKGILKEGELTVQEGSLQYRDIPLKLRGNLKGFDSPRMNVTIESEPFRLSTKAHYTKSTLEIEELFVEGTETGISSEGYIKVKEKPVVKMVGRGTLDSSDIWKAIELLKIKIPLLDNRNTHGKLKVKFMINSERIAKEQGQEPWQAHLAGYTQDFNLHNIKCREAKINVYK
ncbi:MAG: DUF748 domain-containing protein, partial [Candidatus Omnitrophota bacterium]